MSCLRAIGNWHSRLNCNRFDYTFIPNEILDWITWLALAAQPVTSRIIEMITFRGKKVPGLQVQPRKRPVTNFIFININYIYHEQLSIPALFH